MKRGFVLTVLCGLCVWLVCACRAPKAAASPTGLFQLEGNWQLLSTTDDDSALTGSVVSIDPAAAEGMITVLKRNSYCVRPTDVLWKDITTTAIGNQFNAGNLVNSCISGLEYKPATLILVNEEIRLTGTNASGKTMLQTWRRQPKQP